MNSQREAQLPGHMTVTEPAVVGQHRGLALQCGQPFQALPDVLPLKAGVHRLGDISDRDRSRRRSFGGEILALGTRPPVPWIRIPG